MAEKSNMDVDNSIPPPYTTAEPSLPTTYNSDYNTGQVPSRAYNQNPTKLTVDKTFLVSLDCVLLVTEAILSLVALICAAADDFFSRLGGGWIIFVGLSTFIAQVTLFVMYLFRYIYKMPGNVSVPLVELIYFGVAALFFFISGIVASEKWHFSSAVRACAVFCWFALVAYGVDTYRRFMNWRRQNQQGGPSTVSSNNMPTHNTSPTITTEPSY